MRRSSVVFAAATALVVGACNNGQVAVTVALEVPDPEQEGATRTQVLDDIVVELVPFDRDLVFDSLATAASEPEPEIPADVLEAQDSLARAQERWQALETRWNTLRDTLQSINATMEDYSPAEARYRELFRLYAELEGEYNRVDRGKQTAFARFDSITKANISRQNEVRLLQEDWAAEAFADVDAVFLAKSQAAGREVLTDTTSIDIDGGRAVFTGLKKGSWWVHARYELPFTELYWNVPIDVPGGDPVMVELNRTNARERPKL